MTPISPYVDQKMSTTSSPPQDSAMSNKPQTRLPGAFTRTNSVMSSSTEASTRSSSQVEAPSAENPTSFVETLLSLLQSLQTIIWTYVIYLESLAQQYIQEYFPRKGSESTGEDEKTAMRKDSIPKIDGRSRTGTNVRELVMGGGGSKSGSRRGSFDTTRKGSFPHSGYSSEGEQRKSISAKGTGFDEPFCRYRNTTLPHPSADLSHNASISGPDIAYSKVHKNHRIHMPGRRGSSKNVLHGKITPVDAGLSNGGRLGNVAANESAMGSSLSGFYDDIVYADGSRDMTLKKSRTGLSATSSLKSPIEPIMEVVKPSVKLTIPPVPKLKITEPSEPASAGSRRFPGIDWEGETGKALENMVSPLSCHPVNFTRSTDSSNDTTDSAKGSTHTIIKTIPVSPIPCSRPHTPQTAPNSRPQTASSASPIIKPGGFRRVQAATLPNHGKKDSGISMSRSESMSRGKETGSYGLDDEYDDNESITPSRKDGKKGLLRRLKLQRGGGS